MALEVRHYNIPVPTQSGGGVAAVGNIVGKTPNTCPDVPGEL